jgi:hypothetical protein
MRDSDDRTRKILSPEADWKAALFLFVLAIRGLQRALV